MKANFHFTVKHQTTSTLSIFYELYDNRREDAYTPWKDQVTTIKSSRLAKMAETQPTPPNLSSPPTDDASQTKPIVGAEAPAEIDGKVDFDVDAVWKEMNRSPFFMTQLPEDDGEENIMVEALKSMAYEGTRDQIAENFKNQGNEAVGEKRWLDAREFYSKALAALKGPKIPSHLEDGNPMIKVVELDDDETCEKKERALEEACLANRALCQLEMSTFHSHPLPPSRHYTPPH
jgi:hypothetical protein